MPLWNKRIDEKFTIYFLQYIDWTFQSSTYAKANCVKNMPSNNNQQPECVQVILSNL